MAAISPADGSWPKYLLSAVQGNVKGQRMSSLPFLFALCYCACQPAQTYKLAPGKSLTLQCFFSGAWNEAKGNVSP